jgi:hypothetical protein
VRVRTWILIEENTEGVSVSAEEMSRGQEAVLHDVEVNFLSHWVGLEVGVDLVFRDSGHESRVGILAIASRSSLVRLAKHVFNSQLKISVFEFIESDIEFHAKNLAVIHVFCFPHHFESKFHREERIGIHASEYFFSNGVGLSAQSLFDFRDRVVPEAAVDQLLVIQKRLGEEVGVLVAYKLVEVVVHVFENAETWSFMVEIARTSFSAMSPCVFLK